MYYGVGQLYGLILSRAIGVHNIEQPCFGEQPKAEAKPQQVILQVGGFILKITIIGYGVHIHAGGKHIAVFNHQRRVEAGLQAVLVKAAYGVDAAKPVQLINDIIAAVEVKCLVLEVNDIPLVEVQVVHGIYLREILVAVTNLRIALAESAFYEQDRFFREQEIINVKVGVLVGRCPEGVGEIAQRGTFGILNIDRLRGLPPDVEFGIVAEVVADVDVGHRILEGTVLLKNAERALNANRAAENIGQLQRHVEGCLLIAVTLPEQVELFAGVEHVVQEQVQVAGKHQVAAFVIIEADEAVKRVGLCLLHIHIYFSSVFFEKNFGVARLGNKPQRVEVLMHALQRFLVKSFVFILAYYVAANAFREFGVALQDNIVQRALLFGFQLQVGIQAVAFFYVVDELDGTERIALALQHGDAAVHVAFHIGQGQGKGVFVNIKECFFFCRKTAGIYVYVVGFSANGEGIEEKCVVHLDAAGHLVLQVAGFGKGVGEECGFFGYGFSVIVLIFIGYGVDHLGFLRIFALDFEVQGLCLQAKGEEQEQEYAEGFFQHVLYGVQITQKMEEKYVLPEDVHDRFEN